MNIMRDIDPERIQPDDFIVVIEIEKGSKKKYELDKQTGLLILDRILYTSMQYPANYGFIPRTLSEDGDPLDALVLCSQPIDPLVMVRCYPLGVLTMTDSGQNDEKIIAVPFGDPMYNFHKTLDDLPHHIFTEMQHFFSVYKELEDQKTAVNEVEGHKAALQVIRDCILRYEEYNK